MLRVGSNFGLLKIGGDAVESENFLDIGKDAVLDRCRVFHEARYARAAKTIPIDKEKGV